MKRDVDQMSERRRFEGGSCALNSYMAIRQWVKDCDDTNVLADAVTLHSGNPPLIVFPSGGGWQAAAPGDWIVRDAVTGVILVERAEATELFESRAAIARAAALEAQVALWQEAAVAARAERDALWEREATLRAEASRVAAGLLYGAMGLEAAEAEKAAKVRDAVRQGARLLRQKSGALVTAIDRSRGIVGDAAEKEGASNVAST